MMRKISLILICFIFLNSCKGEKSDLYIFYSLFPEIVNRSYRDIRLSKKPLPPPPDMDSIEKINYKEKWEQRRLKLLSDTTKVVILIPDTIHYEKYDLLENEKQFNDHFNDESLELEPVDLDNTINLDISKLKTDNKRVRFEYVSKYPEDRKNNYRWRPDREFDGILKVSRIVIDKTNKFGYFILSYYRGPLDGWGSIIFIKKINSEWMIDGSGRGWVS